MRRGVINRAKDISIDEFILIMIRFNVALMREVLHLSFSADDIAAVFIGWWVIQVNIVDDLGKV